MRRLTLGLFLLGYALYVLTFLLPDPNVTLKGQAAIFCSIVGLGGSSCIYFGWRFLDRRKRILSAASQVTEAGQSIDLDAVASAASLPASWVACFVIPYSGQDRSISKAGLILRLRFFPGAFLLNMCIPTVMIDGHEHRLRWGHYFLELPSGSHKVAVSFPWLFMKRCGRNRIQFDVENGKTAVVHYFMWPWIFSRGSIVRRDK